MTPLLILLAISVCLVMLLAIKFAAIMWVRQWRKTLKAEDKVMVRYGGKWHHATLLGKHMGLWVVRLNNNGATAYKDINDLHPPKSPGR